MITQCWGLLAASPTLGDLGKKRKKVVPGYLHLNYSF